MTRKEEKQILDWYRDRIEAGVNEEVGSIDRYEDSTGFSWFISKREDGKYDMITEINPDPFAIGMITKTGKARINWCTNLKKEVNVMTKVFTREDCVRLKDGENYVGKFVILSTEQFKPEYQNAKNQLFFAEGGFGCYPEKLGGKVFGKLFDEPYQTRREYILGVAKEEAIVEWEKEYGMSREIFKSV